MYNIRIATTDDIPELKELYKGTILTINAKDYPEDEIVDWASCGENEDRWKQLISDLYFIVATDVTGRITGFSSVSPTGYLHSMFIHKDFQHQGIATLLYNHIEQYATDYNIKKIISEVSITARPFFEQLGFKVDEEQKRKANKLSLINYKMSKQLQSK
ncbi:GNAT family N-acetyltransferase [Prevotella sp. 10(H)]|uniref:GNAT family N-acetyltransferase n=1 Tax=Prevotella sp. 10(H) TaxID=1158294 RepID=UPI0004A6BE83|nr:GNAT family N-acetyltransferase [Prevotella sp. 10(H)]